MVNIFFNPGGIFVGSRHDQLQLVILHKIIHFWLYSKSKLAAFNSAIRIIMPTDKPTWLTSLSQMSPTSRGTYLYESMAAFVAFL